MKGKISLLKKTVLTSVLLTGAMLSAEAVQAGNAADNQTDSLHKENQHLGEEHQDAYGESGTTPGTSSILGEHTSEIQFAIAFISVASGLVISDLINQNKKKQSEANAKTNHKVVQLDKWITPEEKHQNLPQTSYNVVSINSLNNQPTSNLNPVNTSDIPEIKYEMPSSEKNDDIAA